MKIAAGHVIQIAACGLCEKPLLWATSETDRECEGNVGAYCLANRGVVALELAEGEITADIDRCERKTIRPVKDKPLCRGGRISALKIVGR